VAKQADRLSISLTVCDKTWKNMPNEPVLPEPIVQSDTKDLAPDPDLWPQSEASDIILPPRNWKQYYKDLKTQKSQ